MGKSGATELDRAVNRRKIEMNAVRGSGAGRSAGSASALKIEGARRAALHFSEGARILAYGESEMRDVKTITLLLATTLAGSWSPRADAAVSWYLLVPPAAYDSRSHLYASVPDAPLPRWYRDGEYDSERACLEARAAKGGEAHRLSRTTTDADNFHREQAWALREGRCVAATDLGEVRRK
jgi:hypothetical protein